MRAALIVTACLLTVACQSVGERNPSFPAKPITILAPANPGGGWDQTARLIQQVMVSEGIAPVPLEVANRAGAGGTIGLADFVTNHRDDPHTILVLGRVMLGAILTNKSAVTLADTVPLVRLLNEYEAIAVPAGSRYKTLSQLIEDFKRDPQAVTWGGGSAGGTDHILVAMLAQAAEVDPRNINYIAHSGGGEAAVAVLGGHVTAGVSGFGEWKQHVQSGGLRFLAVSSEMRVTGDATPTIKESGLNVVLANWRSLALPPGTSDEERRWWTSALSRMRETPAWRDILRRNEWQDSFLSGSEFETFLAEETASNAAALQAMGLAPRPGFYPYLVGFGLLLSAAWILLGHSVHPQVARVDWKGFALAALVILAYIALFEAVGYLLATTLLVFATAWILHTTRPLRDLVASAVVSAAAYAVFELLLKKGLP